MEGSKTITLTVPFSDVLDRVKSAAYYIGESAKNELQDVAAQLQASTDDDDVLEDYLKEAASKCTNVLQHFVGTTSIETLTGAGGKKLLFTTAAPANFKAETAVTESASSGGVSLFAAPPVGGEVQAGSDAQTDSEVPSEDTGGTGSVTSPPPTTYIYPTGLSAAVKDYLADFVLREWTKPIPATTEHYNEKVTEDVQVIRTLAAHRSKPVRG